MQLLVVTRKELLDCPSPRSAQAVLLEGDWPQGGWSLDHAIDSRFHWIDEAAVYWAECLDDLAVASDPKASQPVHAAWLNALSLRYYLVKLLRVVAYFTEIRPLDSEDHVELIAHWGRDKDYADLVGQLCQQAGAALHVRWIDRPDVPAATFPANGRWRRSLARLAEWLEPSIAIDDAPRIVFCGNPRVLKPVCEVLRRRDSHLWWLYDRFAVGSWLYWRPRGVGQLVCDASEGQENRLPVPAIERVECRGVDLAASLRRWFTARLEASGPRQTRILEQIDQHFRRVQPQALVLDEDATPFARAAVALARQHGAASIVVQHGAPCCRFGFAPPAADRIAVWGQSSADQLARWAVPAERIEITGSPQHDELSQELKRLGRVRRAPGSPPQVLLLASVPPRDDRPDAVWLHLNRQEYAEMLRRAVAAVAAIPQARLVVKLHPRASHDSLLDAVLAEHPSLRVRVVRKGSLKQCLAKADCVLSCMSSAGIDATLSGLPVIQLLPAGSGDVLPHAQWGLTGSARNAGELRTLLEKVLGERQLPIAASGSQVFAGLSGSAERIADLVQAACETTPTEPVIPAPIPDDLAYSAQG